LNVKELLKAYQGHPAVKSLREGRAFSASGKACIKGMSGSLPQMVFAAMYEQQPQWMLWIAENTEAAAYVKTDLDHLLGEGKSILLRSAYRKPFQSLQTQNNIIQERAEFLQCLQDDTQKRIIITEPDALAEKLIEREQLLKNQFRITTGETLDYEFFIELMHTYHFEREDFVFEPGQFSVRGGILDVFSFSHDQPYRFELSGAQIESIRLFDPVSQISEKEVPHAVLLPNIENKEIAGKRVSLLDHLPKDCLLIGESLEGVLYHVQNGWESLLSLAEISGNQLNEIYDSPEDLKKRFSKMNVVELGARSLFRGPVMEVQSRPQPLFHKNFRLLIDHLREYQEKQYALLVFSETNKQIERLHTILDDLEAGVHISPIYHGLSEGFIDDELSLCCYSEHQVFDRHYQFKTRNRYSKNQALTLQELKGLQPGDYVVHIDHGIGKFQGLQKIEMGGRIQEAVRIMYKNDDLLYVNIGSLHKISKFVSKDGHTPVVNKLGSPAWQKLKSKTKKKVKDIARDLIKLYAARKAKPGFSYAPDSYLQVELEASFLYEDTPDQAKATEEVKADMESAHPMDRLVCGDVGFGKTEVAVRAAFKAVTDSKQVAILVPTTILAQQHYRTFRNRLEGFPCTVDYINRFRTSAQQKATLQKIKTGEVDIIIGTHRLLGKDIQFKDLGLIIIDEEQKFGVSAKEKLKELRVNVDTLTLTATPIPRTLHFSLMGARDLSIINTPPPNRQPVETALQVFDPQVFKKAVSYELERDGQVFVVHNRVKDIEEVANLIRREVPGARVVVGHGQMAGDELENVMVRFVEGDYDVLVATTIIESGLDIPNANTIIINNAHFFGLSDLHQMRGRVGRSNQKAYCYLLSPPVHTLPEDSRRRLQAIEEFSDLGSGFNVAMRDLDIRGAGNLLGGEQSGFISEIGFDMYHKILDEAIQELKEDEFSEVFKDEDGPEIQADCYIETDMDIMIPDEYVTNISERLKLYTELSNLKDEVALETFRNELKDRFGKLPDSVKDLISSMYLKWAAENIGFEKLIIRNKKMVATFLNEKHESFYASDKFGRVIRSIQEYPSLFKLRQGKHALQLIAEDVGSIEEAIQLLKALEN
jgi:transcription-repair coupling factor (superfamily II helicase)